MLSLIYSAVLTTSFFVANQISVHQGILQVQGNLDGRCSPKFNDEPRYDCVMLQTHDGPIIAQLKFAMTVTVNGETVPIILVQAFDKHENQ